MERKKAGQFQAPTYNVTNTTNVAGDQINCDLAATTVGNTGTAMNTGQSGAPSALNSPSVTSAASGNTSAGDAGGPLNGGGSRGVNTVSTTQDVTDSTQASNVGTTDQGGVNGTVGGSRSNLTQSADNAQTLSASPLNASDTDSSTCAWR